MPDQDVFEDTDNIQALLQLEFITLCMNPARFWWGAAEHLFS
jgi:hypothetical protein